MKRITILNKRIESIFQKKQYKDLYSRLKSIKPLVNMDCPESYMKSKSIFHSYKTEINLNPKKYKTLINNKLRMKFPNIYLYNTKNTKPMKSLFNPLIKKRNKTLNNNIMKRKKTFENLIIDKENYIFNKRLNEQTSIYSHKKFKNDFKKSRTYKKISCEFPSINFISTKIKYPKTNCKLYAFNQKNYFNNMKFKQLKSSDKKNDNFRQSRMKKFDLLKKIKEKRNFFITEGGINHYQNKN